MSHTRSFFLWLLIFSSFFILASPVWGQAPAPDPCSDSTAIIPGGIGGGITRVRDCIASGAGLTTNQTPTQLITKIINWLLSLVAILALLALIIGGIMYIVSFGNEDMAKRAKHIIIYAIIGLLVIFLSFAILSAVQVLFRPPAAPFVGPPAP